MSARFIPVDIKLEARESINSQCFIPWIKWVLMVQQTWACFG